LQKEPCKRILAKGTLRKASSQKEMSYFEKKCKLKMHHFFQEPWKRNLIKRTLQKEAYKKNLAKGSIGKADLEKGTLKKDTLKKDTLEKETLKKEP
jgi:hypothetical protein